MKRCLMLMCVISLIITLAANAAVRQGDNEIDFSVSWERVEYTDGEEYDYTTIDAFFGHFLTDNIQLGAFGGGTWNDIDTYYIGALGRYHFRTTTNVVPYVGALIGYLDLDYADGWMWGPLAGVKLFVTGSENVFVFAEYRYYEFEDFDSSPDNEHTILAGIGIKLP